MSVSDSLTVVGQTIFSSGVGASVGLEAGYTQISSALGSWVGRSFRVRREDMRLLVGCGAAGAIAGAFNGPLTGAFYAFELVIGTYTLASLAPVAAASITSLLVVRLFRPYKTEIDLSSLGSIWPADCIPIVLLGLVCALAGIMVMRSVTLCEQVFRSSRIPVWLRPCLGGAAVGSLALISPQVLSSGHSALFIHLPGHLGLQQLALLAIFKVWPRQSPSVPGFAAVCSSLPFSWGRSSAKSSMGSCFNDGGADAAGASLRGDRHVFRRRGHRRRPADHGVPGAGEYRQPATDLCRPGGVCRVLPDRAAHLWILFRDLAVPPPR